MEDFKNYINDLVDTLTEENVSAQKLDEIFTFIVDYAEDNYII